MALPDYIAKTQGTAIVWGESGGTDVTHALTCDALANGAACQGTYADLGANWDQEYAVYLIGETGTAPTAGTTLDAYLVSNYKTTDFPAKLTGTAGSYTLGTSDANLRQAGPPVVSLIATADGNQALEQAPSVWRPRGRYVAPILDNNLGQALRDRATASDNLTRIVLVPLRDTIID